VRPSRGQWPKEHDLSLLLSRLSCAPACPDGAGSRTSILTLLFRDSRLKTLLHSGLPDWLPTPLRTQAMRSDQPPRILWPALVRSSSPSWIRTNNLRVQSASQLPIVLPGIGADTCPRWSALFSCKRYRHVAAPLIGLEPTIFSLRGRRALPQLHRGKVLRTGIEPATFDLKGRDPISHHRTPEHDGLC
jgi:hypothetical protein